MVRSRRVRRLNRIVVDQDWSAMEIGAAQLRLRRFLFQGNPDADLANHADRFAAPEPSAQFVESALWQLVSSNKQTPIPPITRIVLPLRSHPRNSWNPHYGSWFSETAKRGGRQSRGSFCRSGAIRAIRVGL
jgi:hypothetical protein